MMEIHNEQVNFHSNVTSDGDMNVQQTDKIHYEDDSQHLLKRPRSEYASDVSEQKNASNKRPTTADERHTLSTPQLEYRLTQIASLLRELDGRIDKCLHTLGEQWKNEMRAMDDEVDALVAEEDEIQDELERRGVRGGGKILDETALEARREAELLVRETLKTVPKAEELTDEQILLAKPDRHMLTNSEKTNSQLHLIDDALMDKGRSNSERAVLMRLKDEHERIQAERQEREKNAEGGLLYMLMEHIKHFDSNDSQKETFSNPTNTKGRSTTNALVGKLNSNDDYPHFAGTIVFPAQLTAEFNFIDDDFTLDVEFPSVEVAESTREEGNISLLVRASNTDFKNMPCYIIAKSADFPLCRSFNLSEHHDYHDLCALTILHGHNFIRVEAAVIEASNMMLPICPAIELRVFFHSRIFNRPVLRKHSLRNAMTYMFRLFDASDLALDCSSEAEDTQMRPVVVLGCSNQEANTLIKTSIGSLDAQTSAEAALASALPDGHDSAWTASDLEALFEMLKPDFWHSLNPPEVIQTPLLPYQKRALAWMASREDMVENIADPCFEHFLLAGCDIWWNRTTCQVLKEAPDSVADCCGGILADGMGLGKTLVCLSLVASRPRVLKSAAGDPVVSDFVFPIDDCNSSRNSVEASVTDQVFLNDSVVTELSCTSMQILDHTSLVSGNTLVVCPPSIVWQWAGECTKHAPDLNVLIYDDANRKDGFVPTAHELAQFDLVLCSYTVLASQVHFGINAPYTFRRDKRYKLPSSPLTRVHWHRVILDEAQMVESSVSEAARMAQRLYTDRRWCVTGTPIGRHGLSDLHGLFLFLQVQPFADNINLWRNLIDLHDETGYELLLSLLRRVMWRHSKKHVETEIELPPLYFETIRLEFSAVEAEFYRTFVQAESTAIKTADATGKLYESDATRRLEALRQACCHPQLYAIGAKKLGLATKGLQPMHEIERQMLKNADAQKSASERELCRWLNSYARFHLARGEFGLALTLLTNCWAIADAGVQSSIDDGPPDIKRELQVSQLKNGASILVDGSSSENFIDNFTAQLEIATANSQVAQWRRIELVTIYFLRRLLQRQLAEKKSLCQLDDTNSSALESLSANIIRLTEQFNQSIFDLTDLYTIQLSDLRQLLTDYEVTILPMWANAVFAEEQRMLEQEDWRSDQVPNVADLLRNRDELGRTVFEANPEHMDVVKSYIASLVEEQKINNKVALFFDSMLNNLRCQQLLHLVTTSAHHVDTKARMHVELLQHLHPGHIFGINIGWRHVLTTQLKNCISSCTRNMNKLRTFVQRQGIDTSIEYCEKTIQPQIHAFDECWRVCDEAIKALQTVLVIMNTAERIKRLEQKYASAKLAILDQLGIPHNDDANIEEAAALMVPENERAVGADAHSIVIQYRKTMEVLKKEAMTQANHCRYLRAKFKDISSGDKVANIDCDICHQKNVLPCITACGHLACQPCLIYWLNQKQECPICRAKLATDQIAVPMNVSPCELDNDSEQKFQLSPLQHESKGNCNINNNTHRAHNSCTENDESRVFWSPKIAQLPIVGQNTYGTKITSVIRFLIHLHNSIDSKAKVLIFSSFPRMLQFVAMALGENDISYEIFSSTLDPKHRNQAIIKFQSSPKVRVLLLNLKTDNSGLTLTQANHVVFLEPSLNRRIELQAQNRIHRIGQRRSCYVHHFIMNKSIEESIVMNRSASAAADGEGALAQRQIEHIGANELLSFVQDKNMIE